MDVVARKPHLGIHGNTSPEGTFWQPLPLFCFRENHAVLHHCSSSGFLDPFHKNSGHGLAKPQPYTSQTLPEREEINKMNIQYTALLMTIHITADSL